MRADLIFGTLFLVVFLKGCWTLAYPRRWRDDTVDPEQMSAEWLEGRR